MFKLFKILVPAAILFLSVFIFEVRNVNANILRGQPQWVFLEGNNIRSYIWDTGIFNQNPTINNSPGFEWPIGTDKFAIFTAGLTVAGYVNGELRMAANSYQGELGPGYISGGIPTTNSNFKIYKIVEWDNCQTNPDYANWGLMVPYGAPYIDINNNGQYDDCIDKPGIFNARQTIFIAMTDGFPGNHNPSEGFGGGTAPLNADLRLTAWCYNDPGLQDVQFIKWDIINQNSIKWDSTYFGIVSDPDLGDATDDFIGCDTLTNMSYCYNSDIQDGNGTGVSYGINPPATGIQFLRTPFSNSTEIGMTSFTRFTNPGTGGPVCEQDPANPIEAYHLLKGYKSDGTPWLNPETNPPVITKYCYPGDPDAGSGWTEFTGSIANCDGDTTGITQSNVGGDRRFIMGSGSRNLSINSGDTQTVIIAQHIARGSSNLNSTVLLRQQAEQIKYLYDNEFNFSVSGIVRYSDNNDPVDGGYVKAVKIDGNTGNVITLDSTHINPDGSYTLANVPPVETDIMAYPSSELEDFIPSYYPGSLRWEDAISITPDSNLAGINIGVTRITSTQSPEANSSISGIILSDSTSGNLKDAFVYLRTGNSYYKFDASNDSGFYNLTGVGTGTYEIFVNRLGFASDSHMVNISNPNSTYTIDFSLGQMYVNVTNNNTIIPSEFILFQNYPNPFNPTTKIKFNLPESAFLRLAVYDISGREIRLLVNGRLNRGEHTYIFDAGMLPSGIYFYSLITEKENITRKMVLLK